jgi:hypothetical protein
LKVGNTSGVHCCSTNQPNVTEDSGLLLPAFTAASFSSSLACAFAARSQLGNGAEEQRALHASNLTALRLQHRWKRDAITIADPPSSSAA